VIPRSYCRNRPVTFLASQGLKHLAVLSFTEADPGNDGQQSQDAVRDRRDRGGDDRGIRRHLDLSAGAALLNTHHHWLRDDFLPLVAVTVAVILVLIVVNLVAQRLYPTFERSGYGRIVAYRALSRTLLAVVAGAILLVCWIFRWGF
jgi:hypothetical protein